MAGLSSLIVAGRPRSSLDDVFHRPPSPTLAEARQLLQQVWGYPDFRPHQRKAVVAALSGRDALAVLPTGAGKSLCFQVPALLLRGTTVVVSPLISLMQDQVAALRRRGLPAAYLSSTQRRDVQDSVWQALWAGRLKLLYVAPERLGQLVERAPRLDVSLLAVDEAHCISEWGHDFRPHYRAIGRHRRMLSRPPTIAVTATATPATRTDITRVLGLRRPVYVIGSFDRPNLYFAARRFARERDRLDALVGMCREQAGSAIAYVPTRNRADGVAKVLRRRGLPAAPYHAALPGKARRALLARFLQGRVRVMVATTAFGMGIDKPDVRLVAHLGVPARPEAYYQEAGRAGRDGLHSRCEILWLERDLDLAKGIGRRTGHARPVGPSGRDYTVASERGIEAMRRFVTSRSCRRRALLEYMGERGVRCSGCDRCPPPRPLE